MKKKIVPSAQLNLGIFEQTIPLHQSEQAEKIYSVAEFIDYINAVIKSDLITVEGEISSIQKRGKAVYFTLADKDEEALINCFIWSARLGTVATILKEGMEIKIVGIPSIFKRYGKFSFEVRSIHLVGEGALRAAFEELKQTLEKAGFFAPQRKQPLPRYIKKIGLITSAFADARKDFLTHVGTYGYSIYFKDVRVEGVNSMDTVVEAIRWFNENIPDLDVLVVTRGGGSLESLQAFNSEAVAKAIFTSKIPIISAIGHENDITIADLVADCRASTPTHAGKIISDPWRQADEQIEYYDLMLTQSFQSLLQYRLELITALEGRLFTSFRHLLHRFYNLAYLFEYNFLTFQKAAKEITVRCDEKHIHLHDISVAWYKRMKTTILLLDEKLSLVDPHLKLKQGYSIVTDSSGWIIKSAEHVTIGDTLHTRMYNGSVISKVASKS